MSGGGGGWVPDWGVVRKTGGNDSACEADSLYMKGFAEAWKGVSKAPCVADAGGRVLAQYLAKEYEVDYVDTIMKEVKK